MRSPTMPEGAPQADLQLLRTDGAAPLVGADANDRIEDVAKGNLIATLTKSLGDVDDWTREVVKGAVHEMAVELFGAMSKSHTSLKAAIGSGGGVSGSSRSCGPRPTGSGNTHDMRSKRFRTSLPAPTPGEVLRNRTSGPWARGPRCSHSS